MPIWHFKPLAVTQELLAARLVVHPRVTAQLHSRASVADQACAGSRRVTGGAAYLLYLLRR